MISFFGFKFARFCSRLFLRCIIRKAPALILTTFAGAVFFTVDLVIRIGLGRGLVVSVLVLVSCFCGRMGRGGVGMRVGASGLTVKTEDSGTESESGWLPLVPSVAFTGVSGLENSTVGAVFVFELTLRLLCMAYLYGDEIGDVNCSC